MATRPASAAAAFQAIEIIDDSRPSWSMNMAGLKELKNHDRSIAVARQLTDAGIERSDAVASAIHQAAEHGDHATRADLTAHRADVRADLAALELRLIKWIAGTGIAVAGAVIAALRLSGG